MGTNLRRSQWRWRIGKYIVMSDLLINVDFLHAEEEGTCGFGKKLFFPKTSRVPRFGSLYQTFLKSWKKNYSQSWRDAVSVRVIFRKFRGCRRKNHFALRALCCASSFSKKRHHAWSCGKEYVAARERCAARDETVSSFSNAFVCKKLLSPLAFVK